MRQWGRLAATIRLYTCPVFAEDGEVNKLKARGTDDKI